MTSNEWRKAGARNWNWRLQIQDSRVLTEECRRGLCYHLDEGNFMANTPTVRRQQSTRAASAAGRPPARLRPQNRKLLKWLDSWLSTPDNLGDKWWDAFENDLRDQRMTFRPTQTG